MVDFKFKLLLIAPLVIWLFLFQFATLIPEDYKPEIDVTTLPNLEQALFGSAVDKLLSPFNDSLVLLAAVPYLLHFAIPWVFAAYLYKVNGKPMTFLWCIGFLNTAAVFTHLFFPTAPPWYLERFGSKPATYDLKGDPGRLKRADQVLQLHLFEELYGNSPIVFGSFPSLHAAWPFLIAAYSTSLGKLKWLYVLWVWWAAIYLKHHFLLDLLGGALYTFVAIGISKLFLSREFKIKKFTH